MTVSLHSIKVENLRGYRRAELPLYRPKIVLVGKNNSGKTSILKLLDWLLNTLDLNTIKTDSKRLLSEEEKKLLLPARNVGHGVRRLWLKVKVTDRRRYNHFNCNRDGVANLRVNVKITPQPRLFFKLSSPARGEADTSEKAAVDLLHELRKHVLFIYVPSFRDANSKRFLNTLNDAFMAKLSERALHDRQAGAPSQYRTIKKVIGKLKEVAEDLTKPLWEDMRGYLPQGLTHHAEVDFTCSPEDLVAWTAKRLVLRISTGSHDEKAVDTVELGSGLQSLLDLAIQESAIKRGERKIVLAIEEPEAFLHPSAQRTLARLIMSDNNAKVKILTTHSPIILEESSYGDVVLVRNHEFFVPSEYDEEERNEINTALISGIGAELMFARGVLFVEGEGDRQFFEMLRRRIATDDGRDKREKVDDLIVVPVGSKTRFGPWLRLVRSYGTGENRPIRWLIVADGDAAKEVRKAFKAAKIPIPQEIATALTAVSNAEMGNTWATQIINLDQKCREMGFPLRLLPVDLESAALQNASANTVSVIAREVGWNDVQGAEAKNQLLRYLGSKGVINPSANGKKSPWIRGVIGRDLPWKELSDEVKAILEDWRCLIAELEEVSE